MISADNVKELEQRKNPYIFGAMMHKVKEVLLKGKRYIVCLNPKQARKRARDRQAIIASLQEKIKTSPKSLIGNKGYRKYLKIDRERISINQDKIKWESRFDGKWVLITNTDFLAKEVALKYKELWQTEQVFRDVKSVLETRPVYHQKDENIRGHVFCSFLALVLRKELDRRLDMRLAIILNGLTSNRISRPCKR